MNIRTYQRHLRESGKSIIRNGWMTFASISSVTVTLFLVGVFFTLLFNMNHFATKLERDIEIKVYVDQTAKVQDIAILQKQLETTKKVSKVTYSSKDTELKKLIDSFGEDGDSLKMFQQKNPLSDAFVVKTVKPQDVVDVAKEIKKLQYVSKVRYGEGKVKQLFSSLEIARNIGLVLIFGLVFTAMFLISNTIKITIVARRREIEIMRLVGATNNFIRVPFFLEGLWLGLLGSILPITVVLSAYYYIYTSTYESLKNSFVQLLPFSPFAWQLALILVLIGSLIGIWGSVMSIRKFLRI